MKTNFKVNWTILYLFTVAFGSSFSDPLPPLLLPYPLPQKHSVSLLWMDQISNINFTGSKSTKSSSDLLV